MFPNPARTWVVLFSAAKRPGHRGEFEAGGYDSDAAQGRRGDGHRHHGGLHVGVLRHRVFRGISEVALVGTFMTGRDWQGERARRFV